jgi:hypothetical protein
MDALSGQFFHATQPAKVTPFAGVPELMCRKRPQASFSDRR